MNAVQNLSFGNLLIRVIEQDGNPWFVASDVCAALDIQNPSSAVKVLDEEDKAKKDLGLRGSDANIVSEAGLYTLMLRARDALTPDTNAYRFRKWVTGEVLPTLRKTGSYALVMAEDEPSDEDHQDDLKLKLAFVREARQVFGRKAAMRAWFAVGLPEVGSPGEGAVIVHGDVRNPQVEQWRNARTEPAPGRWIETSVLYADFLAWCQANGSPTVNPSQFGLDLRRLGYEPWKMGTIRRRGLRLGHGAPGGMSLQ